MQQSMKDILYNFNAFIGVGKWHAIAYIVALCICVFVGKKYRQQICLPAFLCALFVFNPFIYQTIGTRFMSGVYWRWFWIFPTGITFSLITINVIFYFRKKFIRIIVLFGVLFCIVKSGDFIFNNENYTLKQNEYKISQSVIDVCDTILQDAEQEKTKIIVPNEMLTSVRQYTSNIGLYYGRNVNGFITDAGVYEKWAYENMSANKPDMENLTLIAKGNDVKYIVFNSAFHELPEDMEQYGYTFFASVDGYDIYKMCRE